MGLFPSQSFVTPFFLPRLYDISTFQSLINSSHARYLILNALGEEMPQIVKIREDLNSLLI